MCGLSGMGEDRRAWWRYDDGKRIRNSRTHPEVKRLATEVLQREGIMPKGPKVKMRMR